MFLSYTHLNIIYIYPNPFQKQDATKGQFFKQSLTSLNEEFSFS